MYIFRLFVAAFLLCHVAPIAFAQDKAEIEGDTLQIYTSDTIQTDQLLGGENQVVVLDTVVKKSFFSGVELSIDYGKLLTLWTEFESKYEAGINFRFYEHFVLAGEFGYVELNPLKAYDNALYYTVTGPYARIGLDYYIALNPENPTNFYYAGLRYGTSIFEDEGMFLIDSEYWEDYEEGFGSQDITATWLELVLGTETYLKIGEKAKEKTKSKLLFGWKFRLRFLMDFENREEPRIYSIPGYGRTFDSVVPALNLYVKYRIGN